MKFHHQQEGGIHHQQERGIHHQQERGILRILILFYHFFSTRNLVNYDERRKHTLEGHKKIVNTVIFTPDGK